MSNPSTSREALYARIRATSRTEVTLEEMQRLGFWPADGAIVSVEADLLRREAELNKALQALGSELREVEDPILALKRMRKERMAQAKIRREETKQRRARERHERALAWHGRRAREVLYLGEGVSAGLHDTRSDVDQLASLALPALHDAQALAQAMGLSLPELRFLAFERRVSRISHYRRFVMPKKTGGERIISAPMPRLKRAQYWVLDNILARAPLHPAAHGFAKGRSIVSNATPHIGRAVVINLDLKDFFPSIALPRVKGVFRQLGYSEQVATVLALLSTESATETVVVDGETFHVAHGPRSLPQGAPSSPALTNILCRRLDARLQGAAAKLGFFYTRYADDLTFSAGDESSKLAGKLLWRARQIVIDEGFTPHPDKQHVMRSSERQSVTGIVVNEKASVDRTTLHRFRATLFQVEKDGPAGKQWNGNDNALAALEGYAHFIQMVDAAKGNALVARVRAAKLKWGDAQETSSKATQRSAGFRILSAQGKAPWEGFWQARPAGAPVLEKTQAQMKAAKQEVVPAVEAEVISPQRPVILTGGGRMSGMILVIQAGLSIILSGIVGNIVPFLATIGLTVLSLRMRRPNWGLFIFAMGILWLMSLRY
jgi:RNA-directed DNA polymerase